MTVLAPQPKPMTVLEAGQRAPAGTSLTLLPGRTAAETANVEELLRETKRRKIWDLDENLHCSIVGTCLSTAELRHLLLKLKLIGAEAAADHDLHGKGVVLARNRDAAAKLLNKTLDRRHHVAINQFARSRTNAEVAGMWAEAVKRGDIPGAYWAVLTHPATSDALLRKAFGEVHMLSHLVGAANRTDIRRLHQLEHENAELVDKVGRQQAQLRDAIVARDARIRELEAALSYRAAATAATDPLGEPSMETASHDTVLAAVERRLAAEMRWRERAEQRLEQAVAARIAAEAKYRNALTQRDALHQELLVAEDGLMSLVDDGDQAPSLDLGGMSLLYVGGRPNQVTHLRALSERASAHFLYHDGGIDERTGMLRGLVSRADIAFFPVDCTSHEAAILVKRLCRQSGKPWIPLRSASLTAFLAAIEPLASSRHKPHASP